MTKDNFVPMISMFLVMIVVLLIVGWVAFSVIKSVGERLFDSQDDQVVATLTPLEECLIDPDTCYLDYEIAQEQWWERQSEADKEAELRELRDKD